MTRVQHAAARFKQGFSCSQAVFSAFCADFGLDQDRSLKLSQPFGGGIARMGLTCGAVMGALLVIGLKHGRTHAGDDAAKEKTYALVRKLAGEFKARHGSIVCRELMGIDLDTPEGHERALELGLFEKRCSVYVRDAVEILERIL